MISRADRFQLYSRGVRLVGFLCFLVVTLGIDPAGCIDTTTEEIINIFPPQSLDSPYPKLLHELEVIHYHDSSGQSLSIGHGAHAHVALGVLTGLNFQVVIKSFIESPFRVILEEIRLHRYVEQLGITPIVIGLLPSGPLAGNISLVYEYVTFSKPLDDWLEDHTAFSVIQWLTICRQIALSLLRLHQHDVLFNDLHKGNILIQYKDYNLRIYIIDFGSATYNSGYTYHDTYQSLLNFNFIAPELRNNTPSTKSSDVFALGRIFLDIAAKIELTPLFQLAYWCLAYESIDRPNLLTAIAKLDNILFGVAVSKFQQMNIINLRHKDENIEPDQKNYLILKHNLAVVSETYSLCSAAFIPGLNKSAASLMNEATHGSKLSSGITVLNTCNVSLHVLDGNDLFAQNEKDIIWLSHAPHDAIRLARLKLTNQLVVVKEFFQVSFENIRNEACITGFFGDLGISPKVIGILIEYKKMDDLSFIQEFYGNGVYLASFVSITSGHEWDLPFLKIAAKGELNSDNQDVFFKPFDGSCKYNSSMEFINILTDWRNRICTRKSYRRLLMERISTQLIQKMLVVHNSGYLLNNCRINNILVNWTDSSIDRFGIDIRLIDLGLATSIHQGISMDIDSTDIDTLTYLAPEVVRGHKTSISSDIYSLCYVLYQIMEDYFPVSLLQSNSQKYSADYYNFKLIYSQFTWNADLNYQILATTENDNKFSDIAFHQYHLLLVKCIHSRSRDRPKLTDLLSAASIAL